MNIINHVVPKGIETQSSASRYRWVVLVLAWTSLQLTFVDRLLWANVSVVVGSSLGLSMAALGVFVTAFYVGYVIANAFGGFASDRFGPRVMIVCSLLPLGGGTFLFSATESIPYGLLCQVVMGLAGGLNYSACVKLIMMWFVKQERGRAMGILTTATSLGVVLDNAIVPTLADAIGWQGVYRAFGVITCVLGILIFLGLYRKSPVQPNETSVGQEGGRLALFKNSALIWIAVAGFFAMWGTWGFAFWANALMVHGHHISPAQAGGIVFTFGLGAVVAKPLIGWVSDCFGGRRKPLLVACFTGFSVMLLIYGQLDSLTMFRFAAPLLGVFAFAYTPLLAALIGETVGVKRSGAATGVTNAIWQLGSLIVPSVIGFLYQSTESFMVAFIALAIGPLLAALAMLMVSEGGQGEMK